MTSDPGPSSGILPPPPTFWRRLRYLGPGLIITASIVGSGELIMTTKLGAEAGFTLLWLVILGCVVKVFVQVELGRYVMSSGETALEAMNRVPGPRVVVSWLLWIWLAMFFSLFFQVSGIAGTLAAIFTSHLDEDASRGWSVFWIIAITLTVIGLLVWGRYRLVERFSTAMVFFFTFTTILAVCLLQWTDYALRAEEIWHGLSFRITRPDGELVNFTTAFAAFGITGVGASELIYYPYWCLEKGYARVVGPREESVEWEERAKGWIRVLQTDAFLSLIVYTVATVAFYLLGAAVLPTALAGHSLSDVSGTELVRTLATMYENTFGDWGFFLFLVGAFFVLYSTYFVATASNARVLTDALGLFRVLRYDHPGSRTRMVRIACVLLPTCSVILFLSIPTPVKLVTVGAIAQACMLPLLAFAALYLRYQCTDPRIRPGALWTVFLWISFLSMGAIGVYKLIEAIGLMPFLLYSAGITWVAITALIIRAILRSRS